MIEALQWELSLSAVWQERSGTGATMAFFGKTVQEQAPLIMAFFGKSAEKQAPLWRFLGQIRTGTGATMAFFGKTV